MNTLLSQNPPVIQHSTESLKSFGRAAVWGGAGFLSLTNFDFMPITIVSAVATSYSALEGIYHLINFASQSKDKKHEEKLDPAFEALLEKMNNKDFSGPDFSPPKIEI